VVRLRLGYYVEVEHGNGIATIYGHMNALYVSPARR
jgi:murein DD-endopeptidase MepM/ murein hydrolase activator NlpD